VGAAAAAAQGLSDGQPRTCLHCISTHDCQNEPGTMTQACTNAYIHTQCLQGRVEHTTSQVLRLNILQSHSRACCLPKSTNPMSH